VRFRPDATEESRKTVDLSLRPRICAYAGREGSEMKSDQSKIRVGGLLLAFSLLFGIGVFSATTAQAQWRRDDSYRRDRSDRDRRNRNQDRDNDRRRDDRYRRNDQYGRGGYGDYGYNVYQYALQQGYQQGLYTGSSDAQRRQSYNPQRSRYYKNADSGYNSSYGSKGQYKQAYRDGFLRGYREGYQRYGYNNRRGNSGGWFPW
jgi:hypothetical protein